MVRDGHSDGLSIRAPGKPRRRAVRVCAHRTAIDRAQFKIATARSPDTNFLKRAMSFAMQSLKTACSAFSSVDLSGYVPPFQRSDQVRGHGQGSTALACR